MMTSLLCSPAQPSRRRAAKRATPRPPVRSDPLRHLGFASLLFRGFVLLDDSSRMDADAPPDARRPHSRARLFFGFEQARIARFRRGAQLFWRTDFNNAASLNDQHAIEIPRPRAVVSDSS